MTWFSRLRNWVTDSGNGIGIRADYHDSEDDNFASGINQCLNIAGLNTPTANISMGNFKLTNAALGTSAADYARLDQAQTRVVAYAADSVGTDSYAITLSPALAAYAVGQSFYFAAGTANTGAATLNINGLGAKTIKKDYNVDLSDGDIVQNKIVHVVYDGTNFQLLSTPQGLMNQTLSAIYAADGGGSDSYAITLSPALSAYATGLMINFKANTLNTGAASLNVNGLGAKTIVKDGSLTLETGDIKASQIVQVIYDGTNFQLLSPISNQPLDITGLTTDSTPDRTADFVPTYDTSASSNKKVLLQNTGRVVQYVSTVITASTSGTTLTPNDNTIPQITEGTEMGTLAITPTNSANTLIIRWNAFTNAGTSSSAYVCTALFQDATAGALNAQWNYSSVAAVPMLSNLSHKMAAGTTSSTTFRIRIGSEATEAIELNAGASGSRYGGGVAGAVLEIWEVIP